MKKQIILVIFILIAKISFGQWQWAKQIGGPSFDEGGTLIDANNNIYCYGNFENECYFQNDTLYSLGINDILVAKYDASGNEVWSKRIGGNNPTNFDEYPGGLVIDNNNSCFYLSGNFYGSLTIDGNTVNSNGQLDIFLGKFDLNGNCLWLKKAGSPSDDDPSALTIDASGNIYWTGTLASNGLVDTISTLGGTFLTKLDNSGNILWSRHEITAGSFTSLSIVNNQIIMSGLCVGYSSVIDTLSLTSLNGGIDGLFAKLELNGNVIWAKRFIGNSVEICGSFETDANNNILLSCFFEDSIIVGNDTLTNNGKYDSFFGKFDSTGNLIWITQTHANGTYGASINSVAKDAEGKYYLTGYYTGNASFGNFNVTGSPNVKEMFVVRYDDNDSCIGIRHFGDAEGNSVQVDNNGDVIVGGDFVNTVNIGSTTLTTHGGLDMFFAKSDAITGIGGNGRIANNQLIIYANPNAGKCNITVPDDFLLEKNLTLSIYDNTGKLVQQKTLEMNEGKIKLNLEAEAKGVYNVTLSNGKKSYNGKIIFE